MAASRSKRSNAGARMAEVMESDARDPFYASVYGGFYDEATDEDYKCTARAAPKKKEDGSGPSGEKEEGAEDAEDGVSEEGSDVESEADSDADDGAEEDEEKEVAEEKEPEQENGTKSLNENKNDTKSINENGKTEPSKTIEEPSPKKVKLSEAES